MIFRTENLIENLKIFKSTTDIQYTKFDRNASTLEIKTDTDVTQFIVGNTEYVQQLNIPTVGVQSGFDVSIDSSTFFNLLFRTTTETISLELSGNNLKFVGNGTFIIPVIYDGSDMYKVSEIPLDNVTIDTSISYEDLNTIITYNSKQFDRGMGVDAVQKLFYLDDKGCITFNTGAVVTTFNLNAKIKIFLKPVVTELFRNFGLNKSDTITLKLGHKIDGNNTYPVLKLTDGTYTLIMVCPLESLLQNYPTELLRDRATKDLGYEATIECANLSDAIDRFRIFTDGIVNVKVNSSGMTIYYGTNEETILFENSISLREGYEFLVSLSYLNSILKSIPHKYMKFRFGDHQSLTIVTQNIYHVIPECEEV